MISMSFLFLGCLIGAISTGPANPVVFPAERSMPWQEGERLTYSASWADVVAAAEVKFEAAGRHLIAGHETRRVSIRARTVGMVDRWIFHVDDLYESFLDPVSFLPVQAKCTLNHGKKSESSSIEMDQAGKTATLANGRILKIPPGTYDLAGLA